MIGHVTKCRYATDKMEFRIQNKYSGDNTFCGRLVCSYGGRVEFFVYRQGDESRVYCATYENYDEEDVVCRLHATNWLELFEGKVSESILRGNKHLLDIDREMDEEFKNMSESEREARLPTVEELEAFARSMMEC